MLPLEANSNGQETAATANVLVYGAGWVGRQIAAQLAAHGLTAYLTDTDPKAIDASIQWSLRHIACQVEQGLWSASLAQSAAQRLHGIDLKGWRDLPLDVVLESVPEQISIKRRVLKSISDQASPTTIVASNSSYFVPSMLVKYVVHPERYLHWHFHVPVWITEVVDIVPCEWTNPMWIEKLRRLTIQAGQQPIVSMKENPGYLFNWLLQSLLTAALELLDRGISQPDEIDQVWMKITGMSLGPFGIMDQIGLDVVQQILSNARWASEGQRYDRLLALLEPLVRQGKLGVKSGQGFFPYSDSQSSERSI